MEGKLNYTISEVADMLNVNQSLIRFWETEFPKIIKPKRNKRGVRFYSPQDVENIKKIYHLVKEKNYTLKGAKAAFRNYQEEDSENISNNIVVESSDISKENNNNTLPKNSDNQNDNLQFPNDDFLRYNHTKVYEKLMEIRKIAEKLLDEQ